MSVFNDLKKSDTFILSYIATKLSRQGFDHAYNIIQYYKIMYDAANEEFTEDNDITLKSFLLEQFMGSINVDKRYMLKMLEGIKDDNSGK